jgi:DNA-binding CsgD family transcriptional regulator
MTEPNILTKREAELFAMFVEGLRSILDDARAQIQVATDFIHKTAQMPRPMEVGVSSARLDAAATKTMPTLTLREHEVAKMLVDSVPLIEISSRLSISVKTVAGLRSSVRNKLDIRDDVRLAQWWAINGPDVLAVNQKRGRNAPIQAVKRPRGRPRKAVNAPADALVAVVETTVEREARIMKARAAFLAQSRPVAHKVPVKISSSARLTREEAFARPVRPGVLQW